MKMIPLFRVKQTDAAMEFYTNLLGFELKYPEVPLNLNYVEIVNGSAELILSEVDGDYGSSVVVSGENVDRIFSDCRRRGLRPTKGLESPVHQEPIDQTWGRREFYVTDDAGNTLRFSAPIE